MLPPVPAEEVIVYVLTENVAASGWLAVTLVKVYELTAPIDVPSTVTFEI
jgi:hypothetical protein